MRIFVPVLIVFLFFSLLPIPTGGEENSSQPVIFVIPFEGEVEIGLHNVLKRGFVEAKDHDARYIFLEMDTPGGRVDAALDIIDLILESEIPVVIIVTGGATSAGAIISLAADSVFMKEAGRTTIGTAAPVMLGGGDSENMQAKTLSYVLAQVRSICEKKGYRPEKTEIAQAMVDKDIEIEDPNQPGKYITEKGKLLTFTAKEAVEYGFITAIVNDRADVLRYLGLENTEFIVRNEHPFERIARFLSSTGISSLLLSLAFLGIFIEFRSPGFGLPGVLGILALVLFLWGHTIAGLAGWEAPLLFIIGCGLIALEVFVFPGFGLSGIAGIVCIIVSVVVVQVNLPIFSPHFPETFDWTRFSKALLITAGTMMAGMIGAFSLPFLFPVAAKTEFGNLLILRSREEREDGYHSADEALEAFVGKRGIAKSSLRPSGIVVVEGQRIEVVSQGGFIKLNTPVEVVKVEGRRIVVRSIS